MSSKYSYLTKYVENKKDLYPYNFFQKVGDSEIIKSEGKLGYKFPDSLKQFWKKIGCGFLKCTSSGINKSTSDNDNRVMDPTSIADIILLKEESGLILPEAPEYMAPDEMPFFEVGNLSSFLYMKPKSDKPNAVWGYGEIIEEDFEKFIWRLYHESPTYYLHV